MAVTAKVYGKFLMTALNKEVDILEDDIKIMLCTSSYAVNQDTHQYKSSITNEVTGSVKATGILTFTGVIADGDYVTIGADIYEFDTDSNYTAGRIQVVPSSTSYADAITALVSAINTSATETISAIGGDTTVTITADNYGTSYNSIGTTVSFANASWGNTTMTGGTDNGYITGGISLINKTLTYNTSNYIYFDADDVQWDNSTITARYAVIYDNTPATDATKPILGYIDFGADTVSTVGIFKITFNATAIMSITIS